MKMIPYNRIHHSKKTFYEKIHNTINTIKQCIPHNDVPYYIYKDYRRRILGHNHEMIFGKYLEGWKTKK